jgi:autotransporter-associated beta strand protein
MPGVSDAVEVMKRYFPWCLLCSVLAGLTANVEAMQITGHNSTINDRFSSGYPDAPVENAAPTFIGVNNDWTGVPWSTGDARKSFAFLSPEHYLVARHFGGSSEIRAFDQTDNLQTQTELGVESTGFGIVLSEGAPGDLSIGTLTEPMNSVKRYPVLDLNSGSSTNSSNSYEGLALLVYGHGGSTTASTRIAATSLINNTDYSNDGEFFLTSRATIQLEDKDSGSPVFADWTNPNGDPELAVIGNHAAIDETLGYNLHSFLGTHQIMASLHSFMNDDGRALRVVGNPIATWVGSSSTLIERNVAWGFRGSPTGTGNTSDKYVRFDPATATSSSVTVNTNYNLRGLYFKSSGTSDDGFTLSGTATLTIGRGGITNYDNDTQIFSADLALGSPQYWSIESGAVSLAALNNNGHLLEIDGSGSTSLSGAISGSGGLSLNNGTLSLSGTSSYTGATWIHGGTLNLSGDISTSGSLALGSRGQLSGTGTAPSVSGSGTVTPGNSPGILTIASLDPSGGLDFDFEFTTAGIPDFDNPTSSLNDLIRITGGTPFATNMDATNRIRVFLNVGSLSDGQTFDGGFFTDLSSDFLSAVSNAVFEVYLADAGGSVAFGGQTYSLYDGPYRLAASTRSQDADFGSGVVSGQIMRLTVEPDPTDYAGWKLFYNLTGNAALDTADDDADGVALLEEFALGGDPTVNESNLLPTVTITEDTGSSYLEIILTRPQGLQDITYTPQTTEDLDNWPNDSTGIAEPNPSPTDNGDGTETLVYRRSQAIDSSARAFMRVKFDITSP